MVFQKFVFTAFETTSNLNFGVFKTFKEAYEYIEDFYSDAIVIIDNENVESVAFFDIIRSYRHSFMNKKCVIMRNLLTVFPDDETVSFEMVEELKKQNEKNKDNKYKTKNDLL